MLTSSFIILEKEFGQDQQDYSRSDLKAFYESAGVHGYAKIPRLEVAMSMLRGIRAERMLDLGCGDGSITRSIGSIVSAQELFGVDISREAVAKALSQDVKAVELDLNHERLPFDDEYFDLVVALELIEHLLDPDALVEEMKRVVGSSGTILLSTPNLANWMNRVMLLLGYQPWGTEVSTRIGSLGKAFAGQKDPVGHLRLFTLRGFKDFSTFHGCYIKRAQGAAFLHHGTLGLLDSIISRRLSLAPVLVFCLGRSDILA